MGMARFGYLVLVTAVMASALVSGCDKNTSSIAGKSGGQVPASVQAMIDAPFAADGQVHVQSRGTFVVKSETGVCLAPRKIDAVSKDRAPHFLGPGLGEAGSAIAKGPDGALNEKQSNGVICKDNGINIINTWHLVSNRQNKPYKLVLAVWQGGGTGGAPRAVWVGGVERLEGDYPIKGRAFHPGDDLASFGEDEITKTRQFDMDQLSKTFVEHVQTGAAK
jgi:hypothetical protein